MGNTHSQYLGPQGLLVNGRFCLEGQKIGDLHAFVERSLALPLDQWTLRSRMGIDQSHWDMLGDILSQLLQVYQGIRADCQRYSYLFGLLKDICGRIVVIASRTKEDYDPIFENLKRIFNDDEDADDLRREVQCQIKDRLHIVNYIEREVETVTTCLNEWDNACAEHKYRLTQIVNDLENRVSSDFVLQIERIAWKSIFGKNDPIDDVESSAEAEIIDLRSAIEDFQSLLGGWTAVGSDLEDLFNGIQNNTEPAPLLLGRLEENTIIEEWQNLAREVQDVNDGYAAPAARAFK